MLILGSLLPHARFQLHRAGRPAGRIGASLRAMGASFRTAVSMSASAAVPTLSWADLERISSTFAAPDVYDPNGPPSAQSTLRLFGADERDVRVTLYRDNHAWCPYCQKVWLFLEEKRIPYRVSKVTMFCYGQKEESYKRLVPSGMLPALAIDGNIITESDDILAALESEFGPLHSSMADPAVMPLRRLERELFGAWCGWLCRPTPRGDASERAAFVSSLRRVDAALASTPGPYFLGGFSVVDPVFTPYVERMSASLFYYKGFVMRDKAAYPAVAAWFDAMETRETYRATQSDFHTHAHDLPPQMGGCYAAGTPESTAAAVLVDGGVAPNGAVPEVGYPEPPGMTAPAEALRRMLKHRAVLVTVNKGASPDVADVTLRAALTRLMLDAASAAGGPAPMSWPVPAVETLPAGADAAARYQRDRVSVPRDMGLWAARKLRAALEATAASAGAAPGPPIPVRDRRDQDPAPFKAAKAR